jgi:hypothetical protein
LQLAAYLAYAATATTVFVALGRRDARRRGLAAAPAAEAAPTEFAGTGPRNGCGPRAGRAE